METLKAIEKPKMLYVSFGKWQYTNLQKSVASITSCLIIEKHRVREKSVMRFLKTTNQLKIITRMAAQYSF